MDTILNEVCVLVTVAFALTLVPGLQRPERSLLSRRDQSTALLVFVFLGLVEEATVSHAGLLNERIVAVCAAGLLAGPWVGLAVGVFVTWLAVEYHGLPLGSIATAMLGGGLAGGLLSRWRPKLAQQPLTGFCLTFGISSLRSGLLLVFGFHSLAAIRPIEEIGIAPMLQALGTALILAIVARVRDRDEQTRAVASAEVRALQARMNPHFLCNALNVLAALATVAPQEVPRAVSRLRQFLRASFCQPERTLVPLEEELAVVDAYLEIESLRFGGRLEVEQTIGPGLLKVLVPPFSFQPLVENAIEHGLRSLPGAGRLRLVIRTTGPWLEMNVTDNGQGVPSTEVERLFFAERPQVHALVLLRRRLQGLFGRSFRLEVRSEIGEGTTITMRIPLQTRFEVMGRSLANKRARPELSSRSVTTVNQSINCGLVERGAKGTSMNGDDSNSPQEEKDDVSAALLQDLTTQRTAALRAALCVRMKSPQLSSLSNIEPMKPWLARCAFLLRLFLISSFLTLRGSSAEFDRIGIVSAFDPELTAIEQAIIPKRAESKIEEVNGTRVRLVDLDGKHLYFFLSGMSMVNAALTTQMAVDHFQLDAIIFAGIAGAVDPALHPGDVVVPAYWIHQMESVWSNPDSNKSGSYVLPEFYRPKYGHFEMIFPNDVQVVRKGDAKLRQVHAFPADHYLLSCAESAANRVRLVDTKGEPRSVYIGGNAMSGPVFLDNRDFREFAFRTWKVRLHEMEGTAIAQVGYVDRIPVLIVRGISDLAGGQHGQNSEETNTRLASRNAALVAAATLNKLIGQ